MQGYIINEWALVRRNELADIPDKPQIHGDFMQSLSKERFYSAFCSMREIIYRMMTDISENPGHFNMPMAKAQETAYGEPIAQESRYAAFRPMKLLFLLFGSGSVKDGHLFVRSADFKKNNKIKKVHILLEAWSDYGFAYEGLKQYKPTSTAPEFIVSYPDNPDIITVIGLMAQKVKSIPGLEKEVLYLSHGDCFSTWSFRLFAEEMGKYSYNTPYYILYDRMHDENSRKFTEQFHRTMCEMSYCHSSGGGNEGPGILYYDKPSVQKAKGPYLFQILSIKGVLFVRLRIRNAEKCFEYLENCPESVKDLFRSSESGCGNPDCKKCVEYVYEGEKRHKCGCCHAPFVVKPLAEDIPHYIKLVELGAKK